MKNSPILVVLAVFAGMIVILNLTHLGKVGALSEACNGADGTGSSSSEKMTISRKKLRESFQKATAERRSDQEDQDSGSQPFDQHRVAGLNCEKYGGPSQEIAQEMVYWRNIPTDARFESPYSHYGKSPKYLTFEPDEGGWNNIRMSMETATVLAHAMGRILVLPPEQQMYLLSADKKNNRFTFKDFFHFDSIAEEHPAVEVISMEEFLQREALTGQLVDRSTGKSAFPPNNATIFDGKESRRELWLWLRKASFAPPWPFDHCVASFADVPGPEAVQRMKALDESIDLKNHIKEYFNNPTAVDAPPEARLREILGPRKKMCIYDEKLQDAKVVHFMGDNASGARLLVHFYAFLFFEDYHQDLWTKRFVRDHLRYIDEIQCAAARVVHAVRQKAIENGNPDGIYDSFHIRRGDFQYKETRISAEEIYANTKDILEANSTIFIATDEKDLSFFDPLRQHYNLLFLNDFKDLIKDVNKNYMGMLDQRIASRGRTFVGAYLSTFTGYINRMRGYHSVKDKLPGWEKGELNSYFYVPLAHKQDMRKYASVQQPFWGREFPVGWRDIDHDLPPTVYWSDNQA